MMLLYTHQRFLAVYHHRKDKSLLSFDSSYIIPHFELLCELLSIVCRSILLNTLHKLRVLMNFCVLLLVQTIFSTGITNTFKDLKWNILRCYNSLVTVYLGFSSLDKSYVENYIFFYRIYFIFY